MRDRRMIAGDVVRRIGRALRQMLSAAFAVGANTNSVGEYQ